ncbi:ABC transporter ATP-binding protein [Nocardia sp. CDC186]|uniref:ABC transporter ATP-binding protein n=1 Tax=Nocardia implantans TaxID=3108168 RepID=A0ABU6AU67_9NOCA|nr:MULTISPECIES: ABC transporter ATP-binding protein [unclassified Nocardia]MBF6192761.1 ABC transporter ATP-binding protein [Nocardia beijingensis]MEA3527328.1 ABC transporter ATP-binding protein [Nocardia sp. CDC192]MEB3511036.1 ABC transporter ATP-binding protein [Nocardia sp. CDC186]
MTTLECRGLTAGYLKERPCVREVDLALEAGQITCLLGPNGAGKTTLLMTLAGLLPRAGGEVEVVGRAVRGGRPRDAVRAGMVLVPDDRALFRQLSTKQNLMLAVADRSRRRAGLNQVLEYFPSLEKRLGVAAGRLSGGEQQMLAIGRAILQRPKVLLIDELSMGLAPVIVTEILEVLKKLAAEEGLSLLLVEQHVHLALGIADKATVLVHGRIADSATAAALRDDPGRVERAYLGANAAAASSA